MSSVAGKVVVITGASSGIGEAAAVELAAHGAKLMLGARRTDRLEAVCERVRSGQGEAIWRECDVTQRDQVDALVNTAVNEYGRVDVIINNAGLMPVSPLRNMHVDEWDRMVDVNIKGTLYGIAATLNRFLEQGSGHIINVSSISGHWVWPNYAVYSATKWAVRAISEGLRQELDDRVRVTVISPGIVKTELTHHITDDEVIAGLGNRFDYSLEASDIANAILWAMEQPPHVDVSEILVRATGQGR
ncbi:SDR family oxidoreductase [bacterium]|nr:SDR family oxidoreductase [bacterium]